MRSRLDLVFARQSGLATIAQVLEAGVSREVLRSRLGRGLWRLVLPHVLVEDARPLDVHRRLVAAQLFAGPGSQIAASSAATWYGVRSAARNALVVVDVPYPRHPRSQSFVIVRRTRRPDPHPIHGPSLWLARPARAVADAARESRDDDARAIVLEEVQRRIVSRAELRHELEQAPRRGSSRLRVAMAAAEAGAWSIPEAELVRLVAASKRLPAMWASPELRAPDGLRLPTPDGWFDDVGLAVQVHSKRFHAGELEWEATVSADGVFAEYGIPLVAVTPRQIAAQSPRRAGADRAGVRTGPPPATSRRGGPAHSVRRMSGRRRPRPDVVALPIASVP